MVNQFVVSHRKYLPKMSYTLLPIDDGIDSVARLGASHLGT